MDYYKMIDSPALEDVVKLAVRSYLREYKSFDAAAVKKMYVQNPAELDTLYLDLLGKGLDLKVNVQSFENRRAALLEKEGLFSGKKAEAYWGKGPFSVEAFVFDRNKTLLLQMPRMLFSLSALSVIEKDADLRSTFALLFIHLFEKAIPSEVELKVVHFPGNGELVKTFGKMGHVWSDRALRQIEQFHPEIFQEMSAPGNYSSWFE